MFARVVQVATAEDGPSGADALANEATGKVTGATVDDGGSSDGEESCDNEESSDGEELSDAADDDPHGVDALVAAKCAELFHVSNGKRKFEEMTAEGQLKYTWPIASLCGWPTPERAALCGRSICWHAPDIMSVNGEPKRLPHCPVCVAADDHSDSAGCSTRMYRKQLGSTSGCRRLGARDFIVATSYAFSASCKSKGCPGKWKADSDGGGGRKAVWSYHPRIIRQYSIELQTIIEKVGAPCFGSHDVSPEILHALLFFIFCC